MEILQLMILLSGLSVSMITAFLSLMSIKKRLDIEKELNNQLSNYIKLHFKELEALERAKRKGNMEFEIEIKKNLVEYENLLNSIIIPMSNEERNKIHHAINQKSKKGKISYISKTFSKSLAEV